MNTLTESHYCRIGWVLCPYSLDGLNWKMRVKTSDIKSVWSCCEKDLKVKQAWLGWGFTIDTTLDTMLTFNRCKALFCKSTLVSLGAVGNVLYK